jgi:hypothetical protein
VKIAIVSDAWLPQTNGVVRTLRETIRCLEADGHQVRTVTPVSFATVPLPSYPEIRLAAWPWRRAGRVLEAFRPDAVHVRALDLAPARRHSSSPTWRRPKSLVQHRYP